MFAKILPLIIATSIAAFSTATMAAPKTRCEILTIHASKDGRGIAPELQTHRTLLQQKPFAQFDSFALQARNTYELNVGEEASLVLPPPFQGRLKLAAELAGKFKLILTLARTEQQPVVINGEATPGAPLFAAGFKTATGVLVFGIACKHADIVQH